MYRLVGKNFAERLKALQAAPAASGAR